MFLRNRDGGGTMMGRAKVANPNWSLIVIRSKRGDVKIQRMEELILEERLIASGVYELAKKI